MSVEQVREQEPGPGPGGGDASDWKRRPRGGENTWRDDRRVFSARNSCIRGKRDT